MKIISVLLGSYVLLSSLSAVAAGTEILKYRCSAFEMNGSPLIGVYNPEIVEIPLSSQQRMQLAVKTQALTPTALPEYDFLELQTRLDLVQKWVGKRFVVLIGDRKATITAKGSKAIAQCAEVTDFE